MSKLNLNFDGFKNKRAYVLEDVTIETDAGEKVVETDSPGTLTGQGKVCVRRNSGVAFLKLEIKLTLPIEGIDEDTFFIDSNYVSTSF